MNAFEFGYAVGVSEKAANVGDALLRGVINQNPLVHAGLGAASYAPVGAALGAYRAPQGQKLRGAGRGALTGAAAGATGGAAGALAAKSIGGLGGIIERGMAGGAKNHLINQLPNVASIGGLVGGYQLAKKRPQAPVAKAANALAVRPLVGELVRQAPVVAKVVPQQAAQVGSNAMKYLGAGAAGLAAGVAGSKMLGGKGQQQPQQQLSATKSAIVAPQQQPGAPKFTLPPQMQQQQRQKFEQGVGKMFGQTAQKVVGGLNTASDTLQSTMPQRVQTWMKADSNNGRAY